MSNNPSQPTVATPLCPLAVPVQPREPPQRAGRSRPCRVHRLDRRNGRDSQFEPDSGYTRPAPYLMWVYKYGRTTPHGSTEAKNVAATLEDRLCARPTNFVRALLTEI